MPAGSALTLLFAACTVIGVVVASTRPRHVLAATMGMLTIGQGIGHIALSVASEHHHDSASPLMLATHLVAIPVGALLIRAAEIGMRRAITSVRRFMVSLGIAPVPLDKPARAFAVDDRAVVRRLLVNPGIGRRGPPVHAPKLSHLVPA